MVNLSSPTQQDHVFVQCIVEVTDAHGKRIQLMVPNTMLSITNALNKTSTQIFLSTKHNQFLDNFDQLTHYKVQNCCNM